MNNLPPLTDAPLPIFDEIVDGKRQALCTRLKKLRPAVVQRYQEYILNVNSLSALMQIKLSEEQKEDLEHCYSSPTKRSNQLIADVRKSHEAFNPVLAAYCQYCGLTYGPRTTDHYLPKELFPEFSVLSLNLVPCCHACNNLKGTVWLSGGRREIISLYYDTLPSVQYLDCEILFRQGVPVAEFSLRNNSSFYAGLETIIRSHFTKLQLLDRYNEAASDVIGDAQILLQSQGPYYDLLIAHDALLDYGRGLARKHSVNYWKVPLYLSMAKDVAFLQYCFDNP